MVVYFLMQIIFCTEDMLNLSLWQAVNAEQSNLEASMVIHLKLPCIFFYHIQLELHELKRLAHNK